MKKTTKPSKTPAPATKKTAPAPALKSTVAPRIKRSAATSPAAPAIVTKPAGARVTITAKIDIGFGNTLYLRGDGAGLSWDRGTPLVCQATDTWTIALPPVAKPISFKFVLNDQEWSAGKDYLAAPGDTVTVKPAF